MGVGRSARKRVKKNHEKKEQKDQPLRILILSIKNVISSTPCPSFLCYRMKNGFKISWTETDKNHHYHERNDATVPSSAALKET